MNREFLLAIIGGFLSHKLQRYIDLIEERGWNRLASYTVGVLLVFPFVFLFHRELQDLDDEKRLGASYFGAYLPFGIGVALGWFVDNL